jgi:hypothetical protein
MILIAKSTLHLGKTIRARDPKVKADKGEYAQIVKAPGDEFDPAEFGLDELTIGRLVRTGGATRKTKSVDVGASEKHEPSARLNPPSETDDDASIAKTGGTKVIRQSGVTVEK